MDSRGGTPGVKARYSFSRGFSFEGVMLYAIDSGYFYAGVVVNDNTITTAAPILRWSIGKDWLWFQEYAAAKNWRITNA